MASKTYPRLMSAKSLIGDNVVNPKGEKVGKIEEIMLDTIEGRIAYAVLSFGGFLGMGDKLFAIPWQSLDLDMENKVFRLNVSKEQLEHAEGFDKDNWPQFTPEWHSRTYAHYGANPYWDAA